MIRITILLCFLMLSNFTFAVERIHVSSQEQWTETRVEVHRGDSLWFAVSKENKITCENSVQSNADGIDSPSAKLPLSQAKRCALIGRIGTGTPFFVGLSESAILAAQDGELLLGINDEYLDDNLGKFLVIVAQTKSQQSPFRRNYVTVPAGQPWTSTSMKTARGEELMFLVPPEMRINCDRRATATNAQGLIPDPPEIRKVLNNVPACALIGKVGKSIFYISLRETPVQIQEEEELFLGINDFEFRDNSGEFRVLVVAYSTMR